MQTTEDRDADDFTVRLLGQERVTGNTLLNALMRSGLIVSMKILGGDVPREFL
jgi:hypothetical protein